MTALARTMAAGGAGLAAVPPRVPQLDLHCAACGYEVATETAPTVCPLCGDEAWAPTLWRPFSRPGSPPLSR